MNNKQRLLSLLLMLCLLLSTLSAASAQDAASFDLDAPTVDGVFSASDTGDVAPEDEEILSGALEAPVGDVESLLSEAPLSGEATEDPETCTHPNAESWTEFVGECAYEPVDERYHTITGEVQTEWYCPDCGSYWEGESLGVQTERTSHSYDENGVCEQCKYVNACKHENLEESVGFKDWDSVEYESIDDRVHAVTGEGYRCMICEDCWMEFDYEDLGVITLEYEHEYENGVCQECGHVNACKHENAEQCFSFDWDTVEYVDDPSDHYCHEVTGIERTFKQCPDCGLEFDYEELGEVTERWSHEYDENGVCTECGHVNTCEHQNLFKVEGFRDWENVVYEEIKNDNRYHKTHGDLYQWDQCEDCGMAFHVTLIKKNATEKESHDYNENGVCMSCEHVNTCKHKNTVKYTGWMDAEFTDNGDGTHTAVGDWCQWEYCEDCGWERSFEVLERGKSAVEGHMDYRGTGYCSFCGAQIEGLSLSAGKNGTRKLALGETLQLIAGYAAEQGLSVTGWKSSASKVASVTNTGLVQALKVGKATITVTAVDSKKKKKTGSISIEVVDPTMPISVSFDPDNAQIDLAAEDPTLTLSPIVEALGTPETGFTWKSSKSKIASVSDGVVTARATGKAKITATTTRGKKKAVMTIQVVDTSLPTAIRFADAEITVNVGEEIALTPVIEQETVKEEKLTWKTKSKKIATVTDGVVKGVKAGKTTVTATTRNKKSASIVVNVVDPTRPTKVTISGPAGWLGDMTPGETVQLTVSFEPETAKDAQVTWKSSNAKAVSVDKNGLLTCKKMVAKSVTITATAKNGGAKGTFIVKTVGE